MAESACIEMAQWQKDEIISKACEWLEKQSKNKPVSLHQISKTND